MIRSAQQGDVAAIIRILHRTWEASFAPHLPPLATTSYYGKAVAEHYAGDHWREMLVAEREGHVVGFGHAEDDLISALHVDPDAWRRGVGSELLAAIERQIAMTHDSARLQVEDFNQRAISLYVHAGYFEIARHVDAEFGSGGMSVLMAKRLASGPM